MYLLYLEWKKRNFSLYIDYIGFDMAGPFDVRLSGEVHGRWVIHFTCGAMIAMHLEMDQDCSSSLLLWVCDPERNTQDLCFLFAGI